jgi:hypothetical protein
LYTPLPFLVLASPPLLVWVVATPFWFLVDFQAVPVLWLYPPAASDPLLHTTRPRSLVTQLANALDENSTNVNRITGICIVVSFGKAVEKFRSVPRCRMKRNPKMGTTTKVGEGKW